MQPLARLLEHERHRVRIIDTEFAGELLVEVVVLAADGNTLLQCVVDHEKSFEQLFEEHVKCMLHKRMLHKRVLLKFYHPSRKHYFRFLNKQQLASAVQDVVQHDTMTIEWAEGGCDLRRLRALMDSIEQGEVMSSIKSILPAQIWRTVFPGLGSYTQGNQFAIAFPKNTRVSRQHRAEPDAQMLHGLVDLLYRAWQGEFTGKSVEWLMSKASSSPFSSSSGSNGNGSQENGGQASSKRRRTSPSMGNDDDDDFDGHRPKRRPMAELENLGSGA